MFELKACIVCLKSDVKVLSMNTGQLRKEYNLVSGLKTNNHNGLPEYLCYQCVAHIRNFKKFRDKCQRTYYALQEVLHRNKEITKSIIDEIDTKILKIEPTLSYLALNHSRIKYESAQFKWIKQNQVGLKYQDEIPVFQYTTTSDELMFEVSRKKAKLLNDLVEECIKEEDETFAPLEECVKEEDKTIAPLEECVKEEDETIAPLEECVKEENETIAPLEECVKDEDKTIAPSLENEKAVVENVVNDSIFDNNIENCEENNDNDDNEIKVSNKEKSKDEDAGGMNLEEEYATIVPISIVEAKAVEDVYKMFAQGKFKCTVCGKDYYNENCLNTHMRMHDPHTSGSFYCGLCYYYYRTDFLLKNHMTEKHMYKYLCKKCPEVNFDRTSAKQHFILAHLQKGSKIDTSLCESQTSTDTKGKKKNKLFIQKSIRNIKKIPEDFLLYSPVSQEEQYAIIKERQKTKNYIDSPFKCEYCYKGFRKETTYKKHMKKHDPAHSGKLQCDACKIYCKDTKVMYQHMTMCHRFKYSCQMCSYEISGKLQCDACKTHCPNTLKMYKHMTRCHIYKYTCQMCGYVCLNRGQAKIHYKWHNKVIYPCPHCKKEFSKESTKLGHIRKMHPSTNICNLCGHSFVSVSGLNIHKLKTHSKEEVEENPGKVDPNNPLYCAECCVQFRDEEAFNTHLGSSNKHADTNRSMIQSNIENSYEARGAGVRITDKCVVNMGRATSSNCEICNKYLHNDTQATRHYDAEHPGAPYLKRYMCDICGHKTRLYANLVVHMRTHTQEKPYACPHCDRRFSMQNNRDRHIVVHTGEKRYQCSHCNRRFSQKNTVKLHIQTVHLKIPYPPWNKKNRKRRRDLDSAPPSPHPN